MAAVTKKLRSFGDRDGNAVGYMHWCPGCNHAHGAWVQQRNERTGAQWQFDGNLESPSFTPSFRLFDDNGTYCHYVISQGQIQFCDDSKHALKGKTVTIPDWPTYTEH